MSRSLLMVSRKGRHPEENWICNAPKGDCSSSRPASSYQLQETAPHECSKHFLSHERWLIFRTSSGLNSCTELHLFNARSLRLPGPSFCSIYTPWCSLHTLKHGNSSIIPYPPETFHQTSCNLNLFCEKVLLSS